MGEKNWQRIAVFNARKLSIHLAFTGQFIDKIIPKTLLERRI